MTAPTPPGRFRFGLRTLFVMIVIVAIPCAWVGYSLNWIRQRREALNFDHDIIGASLPLEEGGRSPFPLWLFGEEGRYDIILSPSASDAASAERISRLFPEALIYRQGDGTTSTGPLVPYIHNRRSGPHPPSPQQ